MPKLEIVFYVITTALGVNKRSSTAALPSYEALVNGY